MATTHPRDDTKAARVIAAFGDFHIGKMSGSQAKSGCGKIRNELWTSMNVDDGRRKKLLRFSKLGGATKRVFGWPGSRPIDPGDSRESLHDRAPARLFRGCGRGQSLRPVLVGLLNDVTYLSDLVDAHKGIHFREQFWQLVAKTLREATRNDQALPAVVRSEEHTSELQSLTNLVCRLLLEKKKNKAAGAHIHRNYT